MAKQRLKNSTWIRIPYVLFEPEYRLTPTEALIAGVYLDNTDVDDQGELITAISQVDIAEKLKLSRPTVQKATEILIMCDILRPAEQRKGDAKKYKINPEILPPKQYQIRQIEKKTKGV